MCHKYIKQHSFIYGNYIMHYFSLYLSLLGLCECFNIDVKRPRIFSGPEDALFGFSVLQHENNGEKSWVLSILFGFYSRLVLDDKYHLDITYKVLVY